MLNFLTLELFKYFDEFSECADELFGGGHQNDGRVVFVVGNKMYDNLIAVIMIINFSHAFISFHNIGLI